MLGVGGGGNNAIIKHTHNKKLLITTMHAVCFSPWTNNVTLLESTVSPLLKVALHWMWVLLYSTDMLLKTSDPCLVASLKSVTTLVRLMSSSRVPFINHSTLVIIIVRDEVAQLNIGIAPGMKTLPLEELSVTKNPKVHKVVN